MSSEEQKLHAGHDTSKSDLVFQFEPDTDYVICLSCGCIYDATGTIEDDEDDDIEFIDLGDGDGDGERDDIIITEACSDCCVDEFDTHDCPIVFQLDINAIYQVCFGCRSLLKLNFNLEVTDDETGEPIVFPFGAVLNSNCCILCLKKDEDNPSVTYRVVIMPMEPYMVGMIN